MLDLAVLAATVVGRFLVPLFTKGEQTLTDELATAGGKAAAGGLVATAKKLWAKITDRFDGDQEKSAVTLFPENAATMKDLLEKLLEQRMATDEELRTQMSDLVEAPIEGTGKTAWQLMGDYVGVVDARGAQISGGTVAGIVVSGPHSTAPLPTTPSGEGSPGAT